MQEMNSRLKPFIKPSSVKNTRMRIVLAKSIDSKLKKVMNKGML